MFEIKRTNDSYNATTKYLDRLLVWYRMLVMPVIDFESYKDGVTTTYTMQ